MLAEIFGDYATTVLLIAPLARPTKTRPTKWPSGKLKFISLAAASPESPCILVAFDRPRQRSIAVLPRP
jgi:hypothetical protein